MRGTFVDKNTGFPLHQTKNGKDAVSQRLRDEGHMFLEGETNLVERRLKWDFGQGRLVHDDRYEQDEQQKQQLKDNAIAAWQSFRTRAPSGNAYLDARLGELETMFRYIAKQL